MVTMQFLRMLVDVAFYYSFAGFFAFKLGGDAVFLAALLQSVCFGLSSLAGRKRWLRLLLLLPTALCWVLYPSTAASILMAPPTLYIVYLTVRDEYALLWERQVRLFSVFWKALIPYAVILLFAGSYSELTQIVLPFAIAMLLGSVLLMRSLRHSPQIYCQLRYQALNLSALAAVVILAFLMSTKAFLRGCAAVLKTIYNAVASLVLELIIHAITWIIRFLTWLSGLFHFDAPNMPQEELQQMMGAVEEMDWGDVESTNAVWLDRILLVLGILAAVVLLVLFFRWLSKKMPERTMQTPTEQARETLSPTSAPQKPRELPPVRSVRAQYRKFLRHCTGQGLYLTRSSTSLDVDQQARFFPGTGEVSGRIREIYLKARYAGTAKKEDAEQMKLLCAQAKKNTRE